MSHQLILYFNCDDMENVNRCLLAMRASSDIPFEVMSISRLPNGTLKMPKVRLEVILAFDSIHHRMSFAQDSVFKKFSLYAKKTTP